MLKFTRINPCGEEKETVLNENEIVAIKEKPVEKEQLFDACGNLVEERENDKLYEIVVRYCPSIYVNEDTYNKLIKHLSVTVL